MKDRAVQAAEDVRVSWAVSLKVEVRRLRQEEKLRTRPLYEEVFSEDSTYGFRWSIPQI